MLNATSLAPPRPTTTLTLGVAVALSMTPSLLPRGTVAQGLLTGAFVLLALAVLAVLPRRATRPRGGGPVLALTGAVIVVLAWVTQDSLTLRAVEVGMPVPAPTYWLWASTWALLVVALGLAGYAAVRRMLRATWRRTPKPLAAALLVGVTVTSAAAGPVDVLAPLRKDLGPDHVMLTASATGASRSFALVDEAPIPEEGADLAVRRMVADGGLQRSAVLIALPTGSGWVNREAVTAVESQLGGDVAVVSAQYGDLPSWWSFLIDQDPAIRSAEALLDGVLRQVAELPPERRPDVYLHGESLGALAGQAALKDVPSDLVCGVIWTGAPAGATAGHPRERSLHNADDPVVYLSADTIVAEPEGWPTAWVPGLSYGTTVLDLGASLLPAAGHGHSYGPEQDWTLPGC